MSAPIPNTFGTSNMSNDDVVMLETGMTVHTKNKKSAVSTLAAVSMFVIALIIGGGAVGMMLGAYGQSQPGTSIATTTNTVGVAPTNGTVYKLTLAITVNNAWNSTTSGPRYWVLTPNGLMSSANISLPANTLIQLTIIDFDSASPLPSQFSQVSGTVGNVVYVVNGTTAAGDNINVTTATAVSALDPNTEIGHTFTVPQLGLNIPVAANSVEVADFYINQTGTFFWHCEDPCGFGPSGWLGPMGANGWMGGTITVT